MLAPCVKNAAPRNSGTDHIAPVLGKINPLRREPGPKMHHIHVVIVIFRHSDEKDTHPGHCHEPQHRIENIASLLYPHIRHSVSKVIQSFIRESFGPGSSSSINSPIEMTSPTSLSIFLPVSSRL